MMLTMRASSALFLSGRWFNEAFIGGYYGRMRAKSKGKKGGRTWRGVAVSIRLLEALKAVAQTAQNDEQKAAIRRHAEMIRRAAKESISEENDINDIDKRFEAAVRGI